MAEGLGLGVGEGVGVTSGVAEGLGDGVGVGARGVDDGDSEIGRRLEIDRVETDAVAADHLEALACRHQRARAVRLGAEENPRGLLGGLDHPRFRQLVRDDHARFRFELLDAVGMNGTGEDHEGLHESPLRE